jgi:fucose permease
MEPGREVSESHGSRHWTSSLIYIGFALTGLATTLLGSALPAVMQRFHLNDLQAGYLFATQFSVSTLGVILSGRFSSIFGFRRTLVAGFIIIGGGITLLAVLSWPGCLFGVGSYGFGLGVAIPTCNLHVAKSNPSNRASALNLLNFVWTGGALAFAPLAAFVVARTTLLTVLGGSVIAFGLLLSTLPEVQAVNETRVDRARTSGPATSLYISTAILFLLCVGTETAWAAWASTVAQRVNSTAASWVFAPAFFWGALLLGRLVAPVFLRKISEDALLRIDVIMAVLAGLIVPFAKSSSVLFGALAVLGFAFSSAYPNLIARMTREFESRPTASGWLFSAASIGATVLPWAVGAVSSRFGLVQAGIFVPVLASALMAAIQMLRAPEMRARSTSA